MQVMQSIAKTKKSPPMVRDLLSVHRRASTYLKSIRAITGSPSVWSGVLPGIYMVPVSDRPRCRTVPRINTVSVGKEDIELICSSSFRNEMDLCSA